MYNIVIKGVAEVWTPHHSQKSQDYEHQQALTLGGAQH